MDGSKGVFQFRYAGANLLALPLLLGRGQFQAWLIGVVEECKQLIIFALAYGIKFVVVALGAADGQAKKDRPGRVDPVDNRFDPELLQVNAAFLIDQGIAVKATGDLLR
jgi:hypothetical protein